MTPAQLHALRAWWSGAWCQRGLPWREPDCPRDLRAMAHALTTRAPEGVVAGQWGTLFRWVHSAHDLLRLPTPEVERRCSPLGHAVMQTRAILGVAKVIVDGRAQDPLAVASMPYCGPYTGSMVALVYGGKVEAPVSPVLSRVAARYGGTTDAQGWLSRGMELSEDLDPVAGLGAVYETVSVVVDLGVMHCVEEPACLSCPVRMSCAAWAR